MYRANVPIQGFADDDLNCMDILMIEAGVMRCDDLREGKTDVSIALAADYPSKQMKTFNVRT